MSGRIDERGGSIETQSFANSVSWLVDDCLVCDRLGLGQKIGVSLAILSIATRSEPWLGLDPPLLQAT